MHASIGETNDTGNLHIIEKAAGASQLTSGRERERERESADCRCRLALGYPKWVLEGCLKADRFLCQKLQLKGNFCDSY